MSLSEIDRGETLVEIGAYCLMPNHFHLLMKEKVENGISRFMEKLLTAYSMFFNKKYQRTGRLFENRFQATHADTDEYLKYLFAYIHLNPIKLIDSEWKEKRNFNKKSAREFLNKYSYSSYRDFVGAKDSREETAILNKKVFPEYFAEAREFNDFIGDWMSMSDGVGK